jgi:hypothetical protein
LSEQYSPEAPPPEEIPPIPQIVDPSPDTPLIAATAETPARTAPRWIAPAWFFFGIIVGIVGFAAYNLLLARPAGSGVAGLPESMDSATAMRAAARDGLIEAIGTLQAGGGPQQPAAQEPQGPQVVANNTFTVRDANRQGNPDAKVTVYEFSDFQ